MKIELNKIKVKDLFDGYKNSDEEGVVGYHGKLNIRPKYQREFVYDEAKEMAVIDTVRKGFPLNVMYWCDCGNGNYEVIDGQQRSLSICEYLDGKYAINFQYFHNLTDSEKKIINDYELQVYICKGTDKERLDWFKTINIAGEKLTDQELRNALYTGEWLTSAKKHFSKTNCGAQTMAEDYLSGSPIRQDYLETVLSWDADKDGNTSIEDYMAVHQNDKDADALFDYFKDVIDWVKKTFTSYRKEMKGLNWGILYNTYGRQKYSSADLESKISGFMADDEITCKKGIYEYVLSNESDTVEKKLSLRKFPDSIKREAYERGNLDPLDPTGKTYLPKGVCPECHKEDSAAGKPDRFYDISKMEADHIIPWSKGGKTVLDNCQMLCKKHNSLKSNN